MNYFDQKIQVEKWRWHALNVIFWLGVISMVLHGITYMIGA